MKGEATRLGVQNLQLGRKLLPPLYNALRIILLCFVVIRIIAFWIAKLMQALRAYIWNIVPSSLIINAACSRTCFFRSWLSQSSLVIPSFKLI